MTAANPVKDISSAVPVVPARPADLLTSTQMAVPYLIQTLGDQAEDLVHPAGSSKKKGKTTHSTAAQGSAKSGKTPKTGNSSKVTNGEYERLLEQLLSLLALYLSKITISQNDIQSQTMKMLQLMSQNAQTQAQTESALLDKQAQAEHAANSGVRGFFTKVFGNKWVQLGLLIFVGLLFIESPMGLAALAAAATLQATGVTAKASTALGNAMGGSPTAMFFASLLITVAITGLSGLAEGGGQMLLSKGMAGTKTAAQVTENLAADEGENLAAKEGENLAASSDKAAGNSKYFKWGNATAMSFSTALSSANLDGNNLITNFLLMCKMNKKDAMIVGAIITAITSLAAVAGTALWNAAGSTQTLMEQLMQKVSSLKSSLPDLSGLLRYGTIGATTGADVLSGTSQVLEGDTAITYSNIDKELAPVTGAMAFFEAFTKLFAQMIQSNANSNKDLLTNESEIFKTNFALPWQLTAQEISA